MCPFLAVQVRAHTHVYTHTHTEVTLNDVGWKRFCASFSDIRVPLDLLGARGMLTRGWRTGRPRSVPSKRCLLWERGRGAEKQGER